MYGLNTCSPETLLKVGAAYPEMSMQEKALDSYIELLKLDQVSSDEVLGYMCFGLHCLFISKNMLNIGGINLL